MYNYCPLPRVSYVPQWDHVAAFAVNYIKKNQWKTAAYLTFDDMLQEAYLVFAEISQRYQGVVDDPKWFMALFKRSLHSRFVDLARLDSQYRQQAKCSYQELAEISGGHEDKSAEFEELIVKAPPLIRAVINLLVNSDTEALAASWKAQGRKKPLQNSHLCQLLGVPSGTDVVGTVREYFGA